MLVGNEAFDPSSFDLIQTYTLSSNQASVTFSNLGDYSSTYKHLQLRMVAKSNRSGPGELFYYKINGFGNQFENVHQNSS